MNTDPQTFRHRSEQVEAVQWTGDNADTLRAFAGPDFDEIDLDDRTEDPDETAAVRESEHGTWRGLKPGDWVVRLDGGLYEFAAADFAKQYEAVPAAPATAPPTGQAGLRDRIAEAIADALKPRYGGPQHNTPGGLPLTATAEELRLHRAQPLADAVLSVLPAPVDRGAWWREAADECDEAGAAYTARALNEHAAGAFALMEAFLRKANETEYVATPCDFAACEPGGEPCSVHERLMAHAEGDHELCAADCGTAAAGTPQPETQAARDCPACDARIAHTVHCPAPESHNWGCGCPGDRLPLYSDRGVDTPGCDCGHNGMGVRWHDGESCAWIRQLTEEARQLLAEDAPAVTLPGKEA